MKFILKFSKNVLVIYIFLIAWSFCLCRNTQQDLFNMLGCMYSVGLFTGLNTAQAVMPVVSMERAVMYRENFAGMYSPWAYSFAQVRFNQT